MKRKGKVPKTTKNSCYWVLLMVQQGNSNPNRYVGIVSRVENGIVYTIEGNTVGDSCQERSHPLGHYEILGYGRGCLKMICENHEGQPSILHKAVEKLLKKSQKQRT